MDSFFTQNLRQFVNTSRHPWRWQYNSVQGVSSAFLQQFEHADAIRQAFFSGSSATFHYEVTPDRLDPNANSMTLAIGDQVITYAPRPGASDHTGLARSPRWRGAAERGSPRRAAPSPNPASGRRSASSMQAARRPAVLTG